MGFGSFSVGHAAPHARHARHSRRAATPDASCQTGGFYEAPTSQQTVDSLQPLPVKWDPTCLNTQKADIYLYAPSAATPRVAVWQNVDFTPGTLTVDLMPRWWNSTASMNLQFSIVPAGVAPFMSGMPAGPMFVATYTKPSSGQVPAAADTSITTSSIVDMDAGLQQNQGLTPGKKAAAVLFPLLILIAGIYLYVRWQRKKAGAKTKRFSVAIDKRMSTISTDWKSVTAAGANAAIRNSMAVHGNRASAFSFGGIRPTSTFGEEPGDVGSSRQMSQLRTGVGLRDPSSLGERVSRVSFADTATSATRQSRVSFANDPRPSSDSARRTRAFHNDIIPPVPSLPPVAALAAATFKDDAVSPTTTDEAGGDLSPRQTQGPLTLTPEAIRARIAANTRARSGSVAVAAPPPPPPPKDDHITYDDVLPALSMMRTDHSDEFLLPSPPPQTHSPAYPQVHPAFYPNGIVPGSPPPPPSAGVVSPIMGSMPMPANVMSPDEMLRAYAERKKGAVSPGPMSPPPSAMGMGMPVPMGMPSTPVSMAGFPMSPPPVAALMSPQSTGAARQLFGLTGVVGGGGGGHAGVGAYAYGGARYEIGEDEDHGAYGGTAI